MKFLVTGGAGFIGSALIRHLLAETDARVVNIDKLTYAGDLRTLSGIAEGARYSFERADIADAAAMADALRRHRPDIVVNLAAETHVDRSIDGPAPFIATNILGTYTLLEAATAYWRGLDPARARSFRFLQVSTDEVFGALGPAGAFAEDAPYRPTSPYAASKAAADHLVRAWHKTYGLPALVSNCSNNYGPYQFPEKLIPLAIVCCIDERPIRVYGDGANVRDWLHVEDHARALHLIATAARPGSSYNVGGGGERTNIEVVRRICAIVDELSPRARAAADLITFVADRPGHDFRYAIDGARLAAELGFAPRIDFAAGLRRTVEWYLANEAWWRPLVAERYRGERLGRAS